MEQYLIEHPIYNTNDIKSSIADLIVEVTNNDNVYTSPINAGKELPRFFVFIDGELKTEKETNMTGYKELSVEIVYEQNYNLVNLYDEYAEMADKISEAIHNRLKYNIREKQEPYNIITSIPMDAHSIKTTYDQSGMHCYFDLRLRVIDKDYVDQVRIKNIGWGVNVEVKDEE